MSSSRCSEVSLAAGESLAATATTAEHWLLIEVRGSWPRDVSIEGALPETVRDAVAAWLEQTRGSRLLFVRRPGRSAARRLAFVIHAPESTRAVRRIEFDDARDLAGIDFATDGELTDQKLVLVCGHGTRDACCALRGAAVYGALAPRLGDEEVWISSHQGGHRFAANVLVLPTGLHFGRVDTESAPLVVARALAGRIDLEHYRGRTCYATNVQAAEREVREARDLESAADLHLAGVDGSVVRFRAWNGSEYAALVEEAVGPEVPASCGAQPEPQKAFSVQIV